MVVEVLELGALVPPQALVHPERMEPEGGADPMHLIMIGRAHSDPREAPLLTRAGDGLERFEAFGCTHAVDIDGGFDAAHGPYDTHSARIARSIGIS
ncbi:hypothetical protein GCM10009796_10970 [Microbacterium koreense]